MGVNQIGRMGGGFQTLGGQWQHEGALLAAAMEGLGLPGLQLGSNGCKLVAQPSLGEKETAMRKSMTSGIRAEEVLDAPEQLWRERPWSQRRELAPDDAPFCDQASSMALASLSRDPSAPMPSAQRFLTKDGLDAWHGVFSWGSAWFASRDGEFWAWAQGDGTTDARVEMGGPQSLWDIDLSDAFAESLGAGPVDKLY